MEIITKHFSTSVVMIEQHYNHVIPKMFKSEFSRVDLRTTTQ